MTRPTDHDWVERYFGKRAQTYDRDRNQSLRWAKEQVAVDKFVSGKKVLDVPLGTGRYVDIYKDKGMHVVGVDISEDMLAEAKRKYPDLDARHGDIFELEFYNKAFDVVVCTRMLDWLKPHEMPLAVDELRRVGHELVVSVRHGKEEWRVNQTHSLDKFYEAIEGLYIGGRVVTETGRDGTEEILHLRLPTWADVIHQFRYHGTTPEYELDRVARLWFPDLRIYRRSPKPVKAEYWTIPELMEIIRRMSEVYDSDRMQDIRKYVTAHPPRDQSGPVTLLTYEGHTIVLDGRRRINLWTREEKTGRHPVLHVVA